MDPIEFRNIGHQVVDLLADYPASIDQKQITPNINPETVRALFDEPPQRGAAAEDILRELQQKLLPNCVHVSHPGYFGLITPTPTAAGILGDFIAAALNQNPGSLQSSSSARRGMGNRACYDSAHQLKEAIDAAGILFSESLGLCCFTHRTGAATANSPAGRLCRESGETWSGSL